MGFSQIEETMQSNNIHICPKCGWGYPNHHPSAKQRRAHKKVCGLVHESQDIQVSNIEEEEEEEDKEIRGSLVDRQISSKSEEDEYSDAVTEFSESDPRATTNGAVPVRVNRVDSKKLEASDLGQKMPVIDFGEPDEVSFSAVGFQVEDDCAIPSNVDHCIDCIDFNNAEQVDKDLLVPEQPAYTSFEGLPEATVKGCEEKAQGKSEVSPTTDTGELTTEMGAQDNSMYTHLGFALSDSDETANLKPLDTGDLEKSQQKEAVCTSRTIENISTGLPEETVKGCEEKAHVKSEVSPTTDTGELTTEMGAQDNSTYTHLGFASSDSVETANLNPLHTGDLEENQQKEAVRTSRTIENVSTGLPEETVKGREEKAKVQSEVSQTTDTGELTTEMGAQDNSTYAQLGFASGETAYLNPLGTGDLEKSQQKEAVCTSRTTENVSTGQEAAFSEVKDVSEGLELHETVSDPQDNHYDCSRISEKLEIKDVENFVNETDQVEFVDVNGSIKSFTEERKHEYPNGGEGNQKAVDNIIAEELIASAVHSVPCVPTSGKMEDSDVVLGSEADSDSGVEEGKSHMAKQLQSMAVVLLDPVDCPTDNVDDYSSSVTDGIRSPRHAANCLFINATESLPKTAPEALRKEVQVAESKDTSHFEVENLSNIDTLTGSLAESPVAESKKTDTHAAHILPDTDLKAPKEEAHETESKSTNSVEVPHLNGTGYQSSKEEALVTESKITTNGVVNTVIETDSQAQGVPKAEPIQSSKKEEIVTEKETIGKLRAPLKSFLLEPNYESKPETKQDFSETPSSLPDKRNINKEWNSPARLPAKRKVRWAPFLCCLPVTTGRTSMVGTD